MNRRIRRKKAKQLHREAETLHADASSLEQRARSFHATGPITDGIRQRALFRARRRQADAVETEAHALRLAR